MSLEPHFSITEALQFKFPWRSYQSNFLKEFEHHIEDKHLHVIAPPGSGKTVLGIEMIRRINKKTLVFSPTLTIRNQWNDRLQECFLRDEYAIKRSYDLKKPETVTFSTYQSLHAFFKNEMERSPQKLLDFFTENGIEHIVLDEAHHLKNEWWLPLFELKKLKNCIYTALTATPPYDSTPREIRNYFDLCGTVDVEIAVPELIKEKNLCPHQDYIHFSKPDKERILYIQNYRERLRLFVQALTESKDFISLVKQHDFYKRTEQVLPDVYANPELYSAILIYLNAAQETIAKEKLEVLGLDKEEQKHIPHFSYQWVELLLQHYLIDARESYAEGESVLKIIEKELKQVGGLDQKRVYLIGDERLYKSLSQSATKLNSILQITLAEDQNLGEELREVILCDYIRKEFLELQKPEASKLNKLGVLPVFHHLRFNGVTEDKLGVLTGSLVILHSSVIDELRKRMPPYSLQWQQIMNTSFLQVSSSATTKTEMIRIITQLFEEGFIKILIGTKSLLGEGWDCPAINTLVLASFVGSFVMSNQMRGRAIRVYPKNPNKIASIWHLACLDPTSDTGGADYEVLRRRFEAFCGVSLTGIPVIENGSDRLDLEVQAQYIPYLNKQMLKLAQNRDEVQLRWEEAIASGSIMIQELKLNFDDNKPFKVKRTIAYNNMLTYVIAEIGLIITTVLPEILFNNIRLLFSRYVLHFITFVGAGIALLLAPKVYKATRLYFFYGRLDQEVEKIARVVFFTMQKLGHINTPLDQIKLTIEEPQPGRLNCFLNGATEKEEKLFIKYFQEVLAPVDNPRYLITQADLIREKLGFSSYFTVPEVFAQHKKQALVFHEFWIKYLGKNQLHYTRNLEGRKLLLKARFNELKKETHLKSKQATIWK